MTTAKRIGLAILVLSPLTMVGYALGVMYYRRLLIDATALIFMLVLLGVVTWIGYTMFTEPESSRPPGKESDLDDLSPETINPRSERGSIQRRSNYSVVTDCEIGDGTEIRDQVNLFKCKIGRDCKVESFVYIEEGVTIGDGCKIKPNVYIPTGVTIGDNVFIGPNVTFTNDKYPRASGEWKLLETVIANGVSIGAHSVILPGVKIGEDAVVGAGAVVTSDIPPNSIAVGNPAKVLEKSTLREST